MEEQNMERLIKALEDIAQSLKTMEDTVLELDLPQHQERLEWYYYEFYNLLKAKIEGNPNRPLRRNEKTDIETSDNSPVSE
jgi:hypothetical protein|tara:strand:+ start:131 stop:373 length:243 start_codon:yes stop_codon:yes gene_type:complete